MKKPITFALALTLMALVNTSNSQSANPDNSGNSGKIQQLANLGSGVHKIQKDDVGRMKSCVIVGQARVSRVLGKAKGLELARKRAGLNAKAEFIKWMDSSVKAVENMTNESIVYLEGSDQGLSESGKTTEVTKENVEILSEGVVRGMSLIGVHQDGTDGLLTVVYGWSPSYASLAAEAQGLNENPNPIESVEPTPLQESSRMNFETKTVTSEDAGEFLGE